MIGTDNFNDAHALAPVGPAATIDTAALQALSEAPAPIQAHERAALERLLKVATSDTGQAQRVADR